LTAVAVLHPAGTRRASRGLRRFIGGSWLNVLGLAIVTVVVVLAAIGPLLTPYDPNHISLTDRLQPASQHHLFGTDDYGRDLFSRVLAGARISVQVAAVVLGVSVAFGTVLGLVSALVGGIVDEVLMRLTDLFLAFPALILAAAVAATLGPSLTNTMLALATVYWPWFARLARGQVLPLREREFVLAARGAGAGTADIVFRHLLRNVLPVIVVQVSTDVGYAILFTSSL
jgi:peptide/nickel transport system permease protein